MLVCVDRGCQGEHIEAEKEEDDACEPKASSNHEMVIVVVVDAQDLTIIDSEAFPDKLTAAAVDEQPHA